MTTAFAQLCESQRTSTPEAAIRGAAARVLRQLGIQSPPVPLRPILDALGIHFEWSERSYANGKGVAALVADGDGYRVLVHELSFRKNWRRTRFTIAHEIMHVLIFDILQDAHLIAGLEDTTESYELLERLCNIGAAELLLPSHWLREDLQKHGVGPRALLSLYDRYLVSREALIWKLAEVIPRGSIVRWRYFARNALEQRCLRVVRTYPGYQADMVKPWLPYGATTKHIELSHGDLESASVPSDLGRISIQLSDRRWSRRGIVTAFPTNRNGATTPWFEGFSVADERVTSWSSDRLLVMAEAESREATLLDWEGQP